MRCPNCGTSLTILVSTIHSSSVTGCEDCNSTFSMSEMQKLWDLEISQKALEEALDD